MNKPVTTVDGYISRFPNDVQDSLNAIRTTIQRFAPDAEESIRYGMPAYRLHGRPLLYFAAFKQHIGFYATPTGHAKFTKALSAYKQGKGSVQFPLEQPLPLPLIAGIVKFKVRENAQRAKAKRPA